jgi:hypothetical protein
MVVIGKPILGEMRLCSRFMEKFSDRVLVSAFSAVGGYLLATLK